MVLNHIKAGRSLQEIGEDMGITKQAVHKIAQKAMAKVKNQLCDLGYHGLDSAGFLRSQAFVGNCDGVVDDFPAAR